MVRRLGVLGSEDRIEVEITSNQPVAPETQVLSGPDRIVIDFPGALPASHLKSFPVNRGGLKSVRAALFESHPRVTRVVLDLAAPSQYQLLCSGNTVIVKLSADSAKAARDVSAPPPAGQLSSPKAQVDPLPENDLEVTRGQLALLSPSAVPPQAAPITLPAVRQPQAIVEALRLRDAGDLDDAAKLLRTQLSDRPGDGETERLLAQTLYWLKDVGAARAIYATALVQNPHDDTLRLEYARMLVETGKRGARELLAPLLAIPATRAEAETLLGRLAYSDGDPSTARKLFVEALADNPSQEEARHQLQMIQADAAPWVSASLTGGHDNQPLDRAGLSVESGWFPTPLTKVSIRVQPAEYWIGSAPTTIGVGELMVARYLPQARLETELAAGSVMRSGTSDAWDWTGRVGLGLRLPKKVTLRGRIERAPYFATKSSLNTPVMVQTAVGLIQWSTSRSWEGEAGYQQQHYQDSNTIRSEYAWFLAPLVRHKGVEIQAGYAFNASNADQSRFALAQPNQPYPVWDQRFNLAGVYAPYFTPLHYLTHSAVAAFTIGPTHGVSFHLNGSYGIRATDDAPYFFPGANGKLILGTYPQKFVPFSARTSLTIKLGRGLTLAPIGEVGRTSFYSWASGGLQFTYRFITSTSTAQ